MKGYLSAAVSLLAAFSSVSALAAEVPARVQGVVGKQAELSLEANPSTGYQWMISGLPEGILLVPGSYQAAAHCQPGMTGCSGQQRFYLLAEKPGNSTLKLVYGRPFDRSSWQEKQIRLEFSAANSQK
ncbi:protease inhibitor I42 family protein [Tatumella saanichensis]|uniref:protease inhibitor I42 family protein n=1 Tax=Tatumella saanichensis TaxID=480813 RepID=UPI0004AFF224|nr:protease inhibitor I42 family protein [Tatumella saanichensis]